jgi:hypothetical protein
MQLSNYYVTCTGYLCITTRILYERRPALLEVIGIRNEFEFNYKRII